jgi:Flp pilus assembly protein TadB
MKMELRPKSERFNQRKYKEELIASHSGSKFAFKDSKNFKDFKDKINDSLRKHFDEKTYIKEQKIASKHTSQSRFDRVRKEKKKIMTLFADLALKLGFDTSAREINKKVVRVVVGFCILLSLLVLGFILINSRSLDTLVMFLLVIWTLVFAAFYLLIALVVFFYLDIRMHQYVRQMEEVLPDYLQLASANISAGMTIDRALWYAIRPKFGILASEMENVAKATIAGEDLEKSLARLGQKYDSRILKETINLIIEGIQSGGEMADLLNKLSTNIKDTQLMRKEISASVTTYAIFIGVATVVAAPLLFALSAQLLEIIQKIFSTIHIDKSVSMAGSFSFNFSGESIDMKNFKIFSILVLSISSFFSASIISVIKKGSVKDGLKSIPLFLAVSIVLYYLASALFASLLGGLF